MSLLVGDSMCRQQKTTQVGCRGEDRLETEGTPGAPNMGPLKEATETGEETDLMERILDSENFEIACLKVKENGGAPGIDGMTVQELLPYFRDHGRELLESVRNGGYRPRPVRRVEIPKDGGKGVRNLGIPTVVDRLVQQAVARVLAPICEKTFSDSSYGFRPERSPHDAMEKVLEYYNDGYIWAVDIDLAKYFDYSDIGIIKES
jgi:retron-type reverse transcriptase